MFTCSLETAALHFGNIGVQGLVDGLISAPMHSALLREKFGMLVSINNPAIRPLWSIVKSDDQNPAVVMTPERAIRSGADRIVVGRPIRNSPRGMTPRDAALRTIDEIEAALRR